MARVPVDKVIQTTTGDVVPAVGMFVYQRGTTTQVNVYNDPSAGSVQTQPLTSDIEGSFPNKWVAGGSYDLYVPTDVTQPTVPWEAVVGGDAGGLALLEEAVLNVKHADYGAIGDGATDDRASILAAVTAANAAGGGIVYFPPGDYYISSTLSVPSSVELVGAGMDSTILQLADVADNGIFLSGSGPTDSDLTANGNDGDYDVTLTSGTGFTAGDIVFLLSDLAVEGGFVTRIVSKATNTLTLEDPLPVNLTTANGAFARRCSSVVSNVGIRDMTIRTNTTTPTTRKYLVRLFETSDVTFERVRFRYLGASGSYAINTSLGRNTVVRGCEFDSINAAATANAANIEYTTGANVAGNTVRNSSGGFQFISAPHATVTGNRIFGNQASGGRGMKLLSASNYCTVTGNVIVGMMVAGYMGLYVLDSWGNTISGNVFRKIGEHAISISPTAAGRSHHNSAHGNVIRGCGGAGIFLDGFTASDALYHTAVGNNISDTVSAAVISDGAACLVENNLTSNTGTGLIPSFYDRANGQAGIMAPAIGPYSVANTALTNSRAQLARFVPSRDMTITKLAFAVGTAAGSDDACDVGIYDSTLTRLVSSGATTGKINATGAKEVTVASTVLKAGLVYFAAFSSGVAGSTAASLAMTNFVVSSLSQLFGTTGVLAETHYMAAAHPLPTTITTAGGIASVPILAVRES